MKRIIQWGMIITIIYLLVFPVSTRIEKTIPAVEVNLEDASFCEPVAVVIDGVYRWCLLGDDTFDGNISFATYPLTLENTLVQGKGLPTLRFAGGSDHLDYGEWMNPELFGKIHAKPFFNAFLVQIYEFSGSNPNGGKGWSWSTSDGHCIVAPANNKKEALSILEKISNEDLAPYEYWLESI